VRLGEICAVQVERRAYLDTGALAKWSLNELGSDACVIANGYASSGEYADCG
jgi:hypothetical protein